MSNTFVISQQLLQGITRFEWSANPRIKGFLIGADNGCSTVLAVWQETFIDVSKIPQGIEYCLSHFSCGKNVNGIVHIASQHLSVALQSENTDNAMLEQELSNLYGTTDNLLEMFSSESIVIMFLHKSGNDNSSTVWETSFFLVTNSAIKPMKPHVDSDLKSTSSMAMRLRAEIPLHLTATTEDKDWSCHIKKEFSNLQNSFEAGKFAFSFDGNRALLEKGGVTLGPDFKNWKFVKDIRKYLKDSAEQRDEEVVRPSNKGIQKPINVSLLTLGWHNTCPSHAPIIAHTKGSFSSVNVAVPIDILIEIREDLAIHKLYTMLIKSVSRQLSAVALCLESGCQADKILAPKIYHFKPSLIDTPVSFVYPRNVDEEKLEKERIIYHDRLLIPKDRPCFKKAAAEIFLYPTAPGGYLVNPHLGLTIPAIVRNGKVALVDGYYSYHHYMQDMFNDDKWGCAYRSLQSIVSWFKYQGYTNKSIPSHREIQEALYKIGDKGEKFVGSRQWIGSFEVSFVLDHLLGVSSKFINVNSGEELSTTGQQLLSHFQMQGTPVMIGGGVLAHTILGVAYDDMTGDIAFLILDPHYTGGEDLKTIQDKGWCGWKDMKFWDQVAHYNMCLPQRPAVV